MSNLFGGRGASPATYWFESDQTSGEEEKQHIKNIDKKLFLLFAAITSTITILLATIAVLLNAHWSLVLGIGLLVGIMMSKAHNWLTSKLALKHGLDIAPSVLDRMTKPAPKPKTDMIVYVEPEPAKDPWIHDDKPEDYK